MKSQTRLLLMLPVLAIAAWLAVFGDKTPVDQGEVFVPTRQVAVESVSAPAQESLPVPATLDESPPPGQVRRLASRENFAEHAMANEDLFGSQGAEPPVAAVPEVPPPPPPPPEPPFVFIGRMLEAGRWHVFLERNGANYVLVAGAEADGFRVDAISEREVRLTQKATKAQFVIPIDGEKKD